MVIRMLAPPQTSRHVTMTTRHVRQIPLSHWPENRQFLGTPACDYRRINYCQIWPIKYKANYLSFRSTHMYLPTLITTQEILIGLFSERESTPNITTAQRESWFPI